MSKTNKLAYLIVVAVITVIRGQEKGKAVDH